ncbi:sulfatase-like hydrolase/transferase [Amycolatopsis tucumanensis]|uniref:Sulfatase-like hydrolase/transferase n=1 Tax=Amycolatopsis tucumanensis TaxID=401106 RepID=A0ABP7HDX4_9PSEU|nr:sulfatase-like hydrolase/transferase [Amycolatopsis tucumanensis]MCF6425385.1 sulfatase-like hydrolase/transferase [Amycolatopsis tucumanensis]
MPPDQRPNILWIVGEDCPPRFGCYGDPHARTPHLDALARRGVVFEHAFSAAPVCAPSRFALLTGVAPESNAPANHQRARAEIPGWMRTYPEILRDLGYYCTNNAKTDYNATLDPAAIWHESSPDAHWRNRPAGAPFLAVFNFDGTHESSVFTPETPEVAPTAVRVPAYLPDTPAVRGDLARHYRHIANLDAFVGELLAQLTADGLAGDTIVIHTSDHGGVHPRSKRFLYDEGLHVPLIIAAPDRFAARFPARGTRIEAAVSTIRIPPTLVDLAGGEIPGHMQGLSLAQQAFDPAAGLAFGMRNRMDERPDVIRTVRDARYRYIRNYHPHRPHGRHLGFAWLAAAYQSWEEGHRAGRLDPVQDAFWRPKPGVELYDTVRDPDQVVNLVGDPHHAAVEERLARALRAHLLAVHDNGFLPEGSPVEGYERSREPGRYPLERVLDVADAVTRQDPAELPRFLRALDDPDATVRRWGAIGILALGAAATEQAARLRAVVGNDPDPFVVIPAAESLARFAGDENAVAVLSGLSAAAHPAPVRLEALNALTALPPEHVRPFRDTVAAAADDDHEYVRGAGRYLLFQIEGTYTPQSPVFLWERFAFTAQGAGS